MERKLALPLGDGPAPTDGALTPAVEPVEKGHLRIAQRKVVDGRVLGDPRRTGRLGQGDKAVLQ
jgi:hypothetical protein